MEHKLSTSEEFKPFKHFSKRMSSQVVIKLKEVIERWLKAGFNLKAKYIK